MRMRCATLAGRLRFRQVCLLQLAAFGRGQVQDFHLRHKYMTKKYRYLLLGDSPLVCVRPFKGNILDLDLGPDYRSLPKVLEKLAEQENPHSAVTRR